MDRFLFTLANGLVIGAIYALSAIGVSLVAGVMRVINFAHGEFYVLGGYFSFYFSMGLGMPPVLAAVLAIGLVFFVGMLVEKTLIRPTYGNPMKSMLTTFILSICLQNVYLLAFGPYPKKTPAFSDGSVHLFGDLYFGTERLLAGGVAILCFGLFYFVMTQTRFGKSIRAVAQDPQMAQAVGIDARRINLIAFGLAAGLAAAAGVILTPTFPVVPTAGEAITLAAFVVIVFGGMGSIRGCLVGGLLLGLGENFGAGYISTMYAPAFGFLLLILMLLAKPTGLYVRPN